MYKWVCWMFGVMGSISVVCAEPLDKVVAIVNDNVITASELESALQVTKHQLDERHLAIPDEAALKKQVLSRLIDEEIQLQLAKNNHVSIDHVELDETISKIASSNHLTVEQMREALVQQGMSFEEYRKRLKKEILISRIQQQAVGHEITVSMQQVNDYLKSYDHLSHAPQTYHVQNIVIPLSDEPKSEEVNKALKKAELLLTKIKKGDDFGQIAVIESSGEYALEGGDLGDRHLAELPEVFAKEVIKMKEGDVVGPLRTANGFQLIKLVSISSSNDKHQVTKTHVRHILLKQDVNRTTAEAERQVKNIYEQVKAGKSFGLMAKKYSVDRASAIKEGDLGWVTSEELTPEFAEAMNRLAVNEISKPVKTAFGWHLIQVLERKTEDDSVVYQRLQVRKFLQERKFKEAVQNWQQHMRSSAYVQVFEKELV